MKFVKIFSAIMILLITSNIAEAQLEALLPLKDTFASSATHYFTCPKRLASPTALIQLQVKQNTGTLAGSTSLEFSADNVTFFAVPHVDIIESSAGDTVSVTGSLFKSWWVIKNIAPFIRVRVSTTGTNSAIPYGSVFWRRE